MRNFISILFLMSVLTVKAQQPEWKVIWQMSIDSSTIWDVDEAMNVYVVNSSNITKFSNKGQKIVGESIKSVGTIEKLDAGNAMKPAVFSEDQQQICFLDNALALQNCIDLSEIDIELAGTFCTSVQTDRIWIYDQLNSQLRLQTLRSNQSQVIQNLKGITSISEVNYLTEFNNQLFLGDVSNHLVILDNYGSLIAEVDLPQHLPFQPFADGLLIATKTAITANDFQLKASIPFFEISSCIQEEICGFKYSNYQLVVSTKQHLYFLQMTKK